MSLGLKATHVGHNLLRRRRQVGKLARALVNPLGRRGLRHGTFALREHQSLLRSLEPMTVIDVGANRGQFAMDVRMVLSDTQIYSFEPLPEAASNFLLLFELDERATLFECALGTESGTAELHLSNIDHSSSLLPIADRQAELYPGTAPVGVLEVPVSTLDERMDDLKMPSPILLKIDVQGYELGVLQGGPNTLRRCDWVYLECSFQELYSGQPLAAEIVRWMHASGFEIAGLGGRSLVEGITVQADILFQRARG